MDESDSPRVCERFDQSEPEKIRVESISNLCLKEALVEGVVGIKFCF